nr:hypothetical protein Iba_scaffold5959CG0100 [Ipomoea batatas]
MHPLQPGGISRFELALRQFERVVPRCQRSLGNAQLLIQRAQRHITGCHRTGDAGPDTDQPVNGRSGYPDYYATPDPPGDSDRRRRRPATMRLPVAQKALPDRATVGEWARRTGLCRPGCCTLPARPPAGQRLYASPSWRFLSLSVHVCGRVNADLNRHPGTQLLLDLWRHINTYRNTLSDFNEVAGRIVRRYGTEF